MQDGDGSAPSIFLAQTRPKLQKGLSWHGQLDKTLSDDHTQRIQCNVGNECDVCENVLVKTDRCFGWERERNLANIISSKTGAAAPHTSSCDMFSHRTRTLFISLTKPMASSSHHSRSSTRERTVPLHIAGLKCVRGVTSSEVTTLPQAEVAQGV